MGKRDCCCAKTALRTMYTATPMACTAPGNSIPYPCYFRPMTGPILHEEYLNALNCSTSCSKTSTAPKHSSELTKYAEPSFSTGRPLIEAVSDLTQRIHNDFDYVPGFTTISTPLSSVLKHRKGVCQDFAHLAIGCLRAMGLAARYISGYLETQPSPNKEHLIGADASHAWFSVYLPNHGWIDFDPTNNPPCPMTDISPWPGLRDFADVTPLKGVVLGGGQHTLTVSVIVEPIESKFAPS